MFSKARLLVLIGFIASIPLSHTQGDNVIPLVCNARFVGNINGGECASSDKVRYQCQDCPPTAQSFRYCLPLNGALIPSNARVPGAGTRGIIGGDIECPNFTKLIRNGKAFGYACIAPVDKSMTHFCGQVAPNSRPRRCARCILPGEVWDGWTV
ncbi:uncharacterized protein MELLADRAFT_124003 [Melampsora larici-populina 98AG31]|uniref:Secreted protein n=1 Tax=Melampsora larici-populina (strain 98AG31 / pathotype 3-4-7) TaxID=747676 RepID=F4RB37_MELLP|nr:uncharacterized protein MELLADRAFT_124003 [Melampsora larici-populina 98AG31]EGG10108.1 secreted protein [Melampsora larici-populina 98AG31]